MPTFRQDIQSIVAYKPGKPIDDVMREFGLTDIIKLASNECPEEPFAPVQDAIATAAREVHRYPDTTGRQLSLDLARHFGVELDNIWVGPGSSSLLASIALATGGEGTSAVFSENSFLLYKIITTIARAESIMVPVDDGLGLDAAGLAAALEPGTTVIYVCNPNNPTGTYLSPDKIEGLVAAVPSEVLVVIDEAYEEYVTAAGHRSALPLAIARDNVVVLRTFSKVYGLAGLRVGYAIGQADTLGNLRRLQGPFATTNVSLAAAQEALRHRDLVAERAKANARGRDQLAAGFDSLGIVHVPSETNFVLMRPKDNSTELCAQLLQRGVIVRQFARHVRVTVGTESENVRFLETLGELL